MSIIRRPVGVLTHHRLICHQVADSDVIHILAVRNNLDDVSLGEDSERLLASLAPDHDERRRSGMFHQINGGGKVGI
jgi:hypothetical protein